MACHSASPLPWTSALALETMTSIPPRTSPALATKAFSAGPSAMSVACPQALTPLAFSASTAAAT